MSNDIDIDKLSKYANSLENVESQNNNLPDIEKQTAILNFEIKTADLVDRKLITKVKQKLGDAIIFAFKLFVVMQVVGFIIIIQNLLDIGLDNTQRYSLLGGLLSASFVEVVGLVIVYIKYVLGK